MEMIKIVAGVAFVTMAFNSTANKFVRGDK
jgi:hypothetical protein